MAQAKSPRALRARRQHGLTLVEMLVAMTCTILLMLAITQTFQSIGEVSAKGRAGIEMSTQLRGVWLRLQEDLQGLTVPVRPWPDADGAAGYFEYYDGALRDSTFVYSDMRTDDLKGNNLVGDVDDILAFTCRSTGTPFIGRALVNGVPTMIESNVAEVIWFTRFDDKNINNIPDPGEVTLHRRVLLVRPDLNGSNGIYSNDTQSNHFAQYDVSVHSTNNGLVANSLADLTQRENRFAHSSNFPGNLDLQSRAYQYKDPNQTSLQSANTAFLNGYVFTSGSDREGEDVILSNVVAFDVRAFDRYAAIQLSGGEPVSPGDPGFSSSGTAIGYGTFVDLNHNSGSGDFNGAPHTKSALTVPIYDTWSFKYEHDGIKQNSNSSAVMDGATDGLDNNGVIGGVNGAVDDVGERETSPPYPVPLRAIQVRLRVVERDTRQVRQATLVQDFLPE